MNREEFEAEVRQQGYDVRDLQIEPNAHRETHAHSFDARLLILDGHLTLVRDGERQTFGPGDTCALKAGTPHEELTGADGVRYIAARRSAAKPAAAE